MNPLLQELNDITATIRDDRRDEFVSYVEMCLDPDTPSHQLGILELNNGFFLYRSVPEEHRDRFEAIIGEVESRLRERGYRTNINTWQEHTLLGSTVSREYEKEPHKPIGIIEGELSIEEAQRARELAGRYRAFGNYFWLDRSLVSISLEPLDSDGNTVRDPCVLDDRLNPVATSYSDNFPARRE